MSALPDTGVDALQGVAAEDLTEEQHSEAAEAASQEELTKARKAAAKLALQAEVSKARKAAANAQAEMRLIFTSQPELRHLVWAEKGENGKVRMPVQHKHCAHTS